jgi:hypothetical protein
VHAPRNGVKYDVGKRRFDFHCTINQTACYSRTKLFCEILAIMPLFYTPSICEVYQPGHDLLNEIRMNEICETRERVCLGCFFYPSFVCGQPLSNETMCRLCSHFVIARRSHIWDVRFVLCVVIAYPMSEIKMRRK